VDVVGIVIDCGTEVSRFKGRDGKYLGKLEIEIADQSMCSIRVSMWNNQADEYFRSLQSAGPNPVVAIKNVQVGNDRGKNLLSMGSSTSMLVNPGIPQAVQVRAWFDAENGHALGSILLSERIVWRAAIMKLDQPHTIKDFRYVCVFNCNAFINVYSHIPTRSLIQSFTV
jgi:hypothetical protein